MKKISITSADSTNIEDNLLNQINEDSLINILNNQSLINSLQNNNSFMIFQDKIQELKNKDNQIRDIQIQYQKESAVMQQSIHFLTVQLSETQTRLQESKNEVNRMMSMLDSFKQENEGKKLIEMQQEHAQQVRFKNEEIMGFKEKIELLEQQLQSEKESLKKDKVQIEQENNALLQQAIETIVDEQQNEQQNYQNNLNNIQEKNKNLNDHISNLTVQLQQSNNQTKQMQETISQKEIQLQSEYQQKLQEQQFDYQQQIIMLNKEIQTYQRTINKTGNQIESLQEKISKQSLEFKYIQENSDNLLEKHVKENNVQQHLQKKIKTLEKLLEDSEKSFLQLVQNGNKKQQLEIQVLQEENKSLQKEKEDFKIEKEQYHQEFLRTIHLKQQAEKNLEERKQEQLASVYQLQLTTQQLQKLKQQIKDQQENFKTEKEKITINNVQTNLKEELLNKEIDELQNQLDQQKQIEKKENSAKQRQQIENLQLKVQKSSNALTELETFYGKEMYQRDQQIKKLQMQIKFNDSQFDSDQQQIIQSAQKECKEYINTYTQEIEKLKIMLATQMTKLQDQKETFEQEMFLMEEKINSLTNKNEDLTYNLKEQKEINQQQQRQIENSKNQEKNLKLQMENNFNQQIQKLNNQHNEKLKQLNLQLQEQQINSASAITLQQLTHLQHQNQQQENKIKVIEKKLKNQEIKNQLINVDENFEKYDKDSFISMLQQENPHCNPTVEELIKAFLSREKQLTDQMDKLQYEFNSTYNEMQRDNNNQSLTKESLLERIKSLECSYNEIKRTNRILNDSSNISKKAFWEIEKFQQKQEQKKIVQNSCKNINIKSIELRNLNATTSKSNCTTDRNNANRKISYQNSFK